MNYTEADEPMPKPQRFYGRCYKYRPFPPEGSQERGRLRSLIKDQQMWFSDPARFNDPFDCNPVQAWNPDRQRYRASFERETLDQLQAQLPNTPADTLTEFAEQFAAQAESDWPKPVLTTNTGIFCMSKRWDSLTQWAYYADGGRGLCLEFEVTREPGNPPVYEVRYDDERPVVEVGCETEDQRKEVSRETFFAWTCKAMDWQHEREVRAFRKDPGLYQYPPEMLKNIIVGAFISEVDLDWLTAISPVPIEQVRLSDSNYQLERHFVAAATQLK